MEYLFDRICSPSEGSEGSSDPVDGALEASVTRELNRIMTQRQYFAGFKYRGAHVNGHDILDFGITRGVGETYNASRGRALVVEIKRAILAYEPRLLKPLVSLIGDSKGSAMPTIFISGYLRVGGEIAEYRRHFSALGEN